jgi:hypothetical protein
LYHCEQARSDTPRQLRTIRGMFEGLNLTGFPASKPARFQDGSKPVLTDPTVRASPFDQESQKAPLRYSAPPRQARAIHRISSARSFRPDTPCGAPCWSDEHPKGAESLTHLAPSEQARSIRRIRYTLLQNSGAGPLTPICLCWPPVRTEALSGRPAPTRRRGLDRVNRLG